MFINISTCVVSFFPQPMDSRSIDSARWCPRQLSERWFIHHSKYRYIYQISTKNHSFFLSYNYKK